MNLHVFVIQKQGEEAQETPADAIGGFTPPAYVDEFDDCPAYAGSGTIFGLFPPGGCAACKYRKPFDVSVDITATLRRNKLRKAEASLVVIVEDGYDGTLTPLADTPVPPPTIRGPTFNNIVEVTGISTQSSYAPDVEALQKCLIAMGYKTTKVVDGVVGDKTTEAINAFQTANGLKVDGVVGPITKAKMVAPQFDNLAHMPGDEDTAIAPYKHGDTVTWCLGSIPGYLKKPAVSEALAAAFAAWAPSCGLVFQNVEAEAGADIVIGFESQDDETGMHIFDGPGGALAKVVRATMGGDTGSEPAFIMFDEQEKWLAEGDASAFGAFRLLPVAIHEVRHNNAQPRCTAHWGLT